MRTVSETPFFKRYADDVWAEEERLAFISFIAVNPEADDVIPDSGGVEKSVDRGKVRASVAVFE